MEHFLQGNVPISHMLNAKPPFMYWHISAFNEVNDCAPRVHVNYSTWFRRGKNDSGTQLAN